MPTVIIELHSTLKETLIKFLKTYKMRSQVTIDSTHLYSHISSIPLNDNNILITTHDPRHETLGWRSLSSEITNNMSVNKNEYDSWRYKLGLAEGIEIVDQIPLECNLDELNYISFTKGCYVGQELTARTKFKVISIK